MTDNDIKEDISRSFLEIIATKSGFYPIKSKQDFGIDLRFTRTIRRGNRIIEDTNYIPIQIKSTTEKGINISGSYVKYPLEVKTYNDLVDTRDALVPLILVLFILPENSDEWVKLTPNELIIKKCAYWFMVSENSTFSNNTEKITISIPLSNLVEIDFFNKLRDLIR